VAVTIVVAATYRLGMSKRLVVIGSGIAGLAAAREASLAAEHAGLELEVTLLEAGDRLGGKLLTERLPTGGVLEWGPDSFLAIKPRGAGLARDLGLGDQLVAPGPMGRSAYLWLKGRLRRMPAGMAMGVPTGIGPLFTAVRDGIVGPLGAARAAIEPLLPRYRGGEDPTAAAVARYRLGRQVAERLVSPLVAGVFGVPYDEVSLKAALPQLADARSWVLAMARRPAPSGAPIFQALEGGMQGFIEAITAGLPPDAVRTNYPVTALRHNEDGFVLNDDLVADAVILATPAHASATILSEFAPESSRALSAIDYHASAVLLLRYRPEDIAQPLDASGFLVAPREGRAVAASSWLNAKWPQNGFADVWIRAIVTDREHLEAPDESLRRRVAAEMNEMMQASASPQETRMQRWPDALPVYAPGHQKRVRAAVEHLPEMLELAGAAYRGFGIPDCIATGEEAARRLVERLAADPVTGA
jgi:oxygen-dependent protoporphyrinogen oxidase